MALTSPRVSQKFLEGSPPGALEAYLGDAMSFPEGSPKVSQPGALPVYLTNFGNIELMALTFPKSFPKV